MKKNKDIEKIILDFLDPLSDEIYSDIEYEYFGKRSNFSTASYTVVRNWLFAMNDEEVLAMISRLKHKYNR